MRKKIRGKESGLKPDDGHWLDLEAFARVELTSEAEGYPIEAAFDETGSGWRAAESGEQTISVIFDHPQSIRRIYLRIDEREFECTQQLTLQWSSQEHGPLRPLVQQQWNFSPTGSNSEIEDYQVNLTGVLRLELVITPDISGRRALASLASYRLSTEPRS